MEDIVKVIRGHVPDAAIPLLSKYLKYWEVNLVITQKRFTKHGDFRMLPNGGHQITVNNMANPYRFLITVIHEIAHLVTFKDFGLSIKPHGIEWKNSYKKLMAPFLNPEIFPDVLLRQLARHFKNPKASTDADFNLVIELNRFDPQTEKIYIFELEPGMVFEIHNGKRFILGLKQKKRYQCEEIVTRRKYLFSPHAQVKKIEKRS